MNINDFILNLAVSIYPNDPRLIGGVIVCIVTIIALLVIKEVLALVLSKFPIFQKFALEKIIEIQIQKISLPLILYTGIFTALTYSGFKTQHETIDSLLKFLFYIGWTIQLIDLINKIIKISIQRIIGRIDNKSTISAYTFLSISLRAAIWVIGILFVLSNLGYDVNAFVAGLGIGGLAIALALQNILKDLFSSVLILTDKPIRINDYVTTGDVSGVVKEIGIRSTRFMADDGSEVIVPNGDLVNRTIRNYKSRITQKVSLSMTLDNVEGKNTMQDINDVLNQNPNIKDGTLYIYLVEKNPEEQKYKISFNTSRTESREIALKLEEIMNEIYNMILKKGYNIKALVLDNPKV